MKIKRLFKIYATEQTTYIFLSLFINTMKQFFGLQQGKTNNAADHVSNLSRFGSPT